MSEKKAEKVKRVRIFLTKTDTEGNEGIVSLPIHGGIYPLIAVSDDQYDRFAKIAQEMANASGKEIYVVEFTKREEVARFEQKLVVEASNITG